MTRADKTARERGFSRARVLTLVAVAIVAFVALSVAAYLRFDPAYFQSLLVNQVERRYDVKLSFSDYRVALWPQLGLEINDASMISKAPGTTRPLVTMKSARVYLRPIPILWGRFAVSQIVLEEPDLFLERGPDGKLNLPSPVKEDEGKEKDETSDIGGRVFLTRTKITRGKATLVDYSRAAEPVTTRLESFELVMKDLAYGREPEFRLQAVTAGEAAGSKIDLEGRLGEIEPDMAFSALSLDIRLKSENFDIGPFQGYLPENWKRRVRSGVLSSDLDISGSLAEGLDVEGDIRIEQADFGDSYQLTGTIAGTISVSGEEGITRGRAALRLAPGRFLKGSLDIDGESHVKSSFRSGEGGFHAEIDIDATKAAYRQGDVFGKGPGEVLELKGVLDSAKEGLRITEARGTLGKIRFTGSAEIGRPVAEGRSTPFDLHFAPEKIDLAALGNYVEAIAPNALGGEAQVSRLDILRRPEETREYQVTIDASLFGVSARFPLDDGRAHVLRDLTGDIAIKPGLLEAPNASATVNGVPVRFKAEVEEFMATLTPDPDRRKAIIRLEAWNESIDLDKLLEPAGAGPAERVVDEGAGAVAMAQIPEGTEHPPAAEAPEAAAQGEEWQVPPPAARGGGPRERFVERFFLKEGVIRAERAVYAEQALTNLAASFTYYDPVLELRKTTFKQAEGDWMVSGTVALNGTTTFDLAAEVAGARVEALSRAFSKSDTPSRIFGILKGNAVLHGQGSDLAAWEKTLRGSGEIVVTDGRLPGFNIYEVVIQAVLGVVAKIVPVGKIGSLSKENTFERFAEHFKIERGRIWTEDLYLETVDYYLKGKGSVGLDQSLDYDTTVELTPEGTQKMVTVASLPILRTSSARIAPIPVRITGTTDKPKIVPNASVISVGTLTSLFKGVTGGGAAIVKEGLKGILGGVGGKSGEEETAEPPAEPDEAPPPAPPEKEKPDLVEQGVRELQRFLGR